MVMKLYAGWNFPSNIAKLALHEKNAAFELVATDYMNSKTQEYLATKNPFGKAPSLEDDDLVVFESRAIARYAAAKFEGQGTPLLGSTLKEHALVNVWIDVESQSFTTALWPIAMQLINKSNKTPDAAVIEPNMEKLSKVLDIYESQLSKHTYLAGNFFSLADLFHIPSLHFFWYAADPVHKAPFTSRPHVNAWYEDIKARPAWQKVLQSHGEKI